MGDVSSGLIFVDETVIAQIRVRSVSSRPVSTPMVHVPTSMIARTTPFVSVADASKRFHVPITDSVDKLVFPYFVADKAFVRPKSISVSVTLIVLLETAAPSASVYPRQVQSVYETDIALRVNSAKARFVSWNDRVINGLNQGAISRRLPSLDKATPGSSI